VANGIVSIIHTTLVHTSSGWHATWPAQRLACGGTAADRIYWLQHEIWILRFSNGGRVAQANESSFSYSPGCGYGRSSIIWHATFANPSTKTNNSTAP
jgi:hypothetical protein